MKSILLIVFIFISQIVLAQDLPTFPLVTAQELQAKVYAKDSTAEAYIINDYGSGAVYEGAEGYQVSYRYCMRIKILKKSAYKRSTVTVYLYGRNSDTSYESIEDVKGKTYNWENEQIVTEELAEKDVFHAKRSDSYEKVTFTLPQVKEGSIIEYSYTIHSPYPFKPKDCVLQTDIPTVQSEYKFSYPNNFSYRIITQATQGFFATETYEERNQHHNYHWIMNNIPAQKEENFVANIDDYRRMIHFELVEYILGGMSKPKSFSKTWEVLDNDMLQDDNFGATIKKIGAFNETTELLKGQKLDTLSLAKEVFRFVQQNFTWNGEKSLYTSSALKQVFENKRGNSSDLNLLLIALLRQVGVEANPVILSTREHGLIWKDYPMITRFNYAIVYVNIQGKSVFLDATSKILNWGMLPAYCMSYEGRLLVSRHSRWVFITTPEKSIELVDIKMQLAKDGLVKGTMVLSGNGYHGVALREKMGILGKEKLSKELLEKQPQWTNTQIDFEGFENNNQGQMPKIVINTQISDAFNQVADKVYLLPFLQEGLKITPLSSPERTFPVDFTYPQEEIISCKFELGNDYTIEELPKGMHIALPNDGGRFFYSATVDDSNVLIVASRIQLRRAFYAVEEYQALRKFYEQIVQKHGEMVVLKRK
jgi:hypothetical protein